MNKTAPKVPLRVTDNRYIEIQGQKQNTLFQMTHWSRSSESHFIYSRMSGQHPSHATVACDDVENSRWKTSFCTDLGKK